MVPKTGTFMMLDTHHTDATSKLTQLEPGETTLDLCAPTFVSDIAFVPLVRESYALGCSLSILFMRNEPVGRVYHGGDLDNRIKTLLDALTIPQANQVCADTEREMHVLLEDDSRVTGVSVDTCQLLSNPDKPKNEVRLVIGVTVTVLDARGYNMPFLAD
jgi:hypothetical protein